MKFFTRMTGGMIATLRSHLKDTDSKVMANTFWLYGEQAVRAIMALATLGVVARYLGTENFGLLAYAIAFPSVFLPLAKLGLDYVIVQELVLRPEQSRRVLGTASGLIAAAGILAAAISLGTLSWVDAPAGAKRMIWITSWILAVQPMLVFDFYFQGKIAARNVVLARLGTNIASNVCRLVFVGLDAPLIWFAWLVLAELMLLGGVLWKVARNAEDARFHPLRDFSFDEAKFLMRSAWPLMLSSVAMVCYLRLDQIWLTRLSGVGELGVYAAAMRFADMGQLVAYSVINSYFPRIVALRASNEQEWTHGVQRFWRRINWLGIAVAIGLTIMAPVLTSGLLGRDFGGALWPLVIIAWGNVFCAQIGVRGKWLLVEGMQIYTLYFFVGGALVHLVGLWLLAPTLGATGAALSYAAAHCAMLFLMPALFARTRFLAAMAFRAFKLNLHVHT